MGFRVQLIAVSGKEPRAIQRDYGVIPTGEREELPESRLSAQRCPMAPICCTSTTKTRSYQTMRFSRVFQKAPH